MEVTDDANGSQTVMLGCLIRFFPGKVLRFILFFIGGRRRASSEAIVERTISIVSLVTVLDRVS